MTPNSLAFIALSNEYCQAIEAAAEAVSPRRFVADMLRLLPRLYITASDLAPEPLLGDDESPMLENYLSEDFYEQACQGMESLLGSDDVFLEVFEDDMQYSDTPLRASISENLADIYQVLYNFVTTVREAPDYVANEALHAVREEFASYWSQRLVNVMRPLNQLRYSATAEDDEDVDDDSIDGEDDY